MIKAQADHPDRSNRPNKQVKFWQAGILWIVLSFCCFLILIFLSSQIWRDRTQAHTRDECTMLADAVLKQSVIERRSIWKNNLFHKNYYLSINALAGWAAAYGGTDEEEYDMIFQSLEHVPDGTAILKDGTYTVLSGEFPRKEFDRALENRKADLTRFAAEPPASTSVLLFDGDTAYLSSEFPGAETLVISRIVGDEAFAEEIQPVFEDLVSSDSFYLNSGINLVIVSVADNKVTQVIGDLHLEAGSVFDEMPDAAGNLKIGSTACIAGTSENKTTRVYAVAPASSIFSRTMVSPVLLSLLFSLQFFLTVVYAWFLRDDLQRGRVESSKGSSHNVSLSSLLLRHVRMMFILSSIIVIALILLLCSLYVIDSNRLWGQKILMDIEHYISVDEESSAGLTSFRKENKLDTLDKICRLIDQSPERATEEAFKDLKKAIDREIYLLNPSGAVEASSEKEYDFSGITDPYSNLHEISGILDGKADHKGIAMSDNSSISRLLWAARCKDSERVLITVDNFTDAISITDYYADYKVPEGLILFTINLSTNEVMASSEHAYCGTDLDELGIDKATFTDGYVGDLMLGGVRYFAQTNVKGGRADMIASDLADLFRTYLPVILTTAAAGFLIVLLMFIIAFVLQRRIWTNLEASKVPEASKKYTTLDEDATFYHEEDGSIHPDRGAVGRWQDISMPFSKQSADEKIHTVLHILFIVTLIVGSVPYERGNVSDVTDSTIAFLLQRSWSFGFNVYAVSYALLNIFTILVIGFAIRRVLLMIGRIFGNRGETITRLIGSFAAYATVLGAIAYSLIFIGVDTSAILASAGLLGLGISIGAKDLISDILAGISIVFEGAFRTGDIVEIGGFRGTVEEIGIRSTKIMSMENVKLFRNSEISGVINMTQRYSIAQVRVNISRTESLEEVAETFRKELPQIRTRIPEAMSKIELAGIDQLNAGDVILLFETKCKETDRIELERKLKWELDLVMEKEQIASK